MSFEEGTPAARAPLGRRRLLRILPWLALALALALWGRHEFLDAEETAGRTASALAPVYPPRARHTIAEIDAARLRARDRVEVAGPAAPPDETPDRRLGSAARGLPDADADFVSDAQGDTVAAGTGFPPPDFNTADRACFRQAMASVDPVLVAAALPPTPAGFAVAVGLHRLAADVTVALQPMPDETPQRSLDGAVRNAPDVSPTGRRSGGTEGDGSARRLMVAATVAADPLAVVAAPGLDAASDAPRGRLVWWLLALLGVAALQWVLLARTRENRRLHGQLDQSRSEASDRLAELQALYVEAPLGLARLDRELRFVRINETLAQMNGASAADHIGRTVWDLVPDLRASAEPALRAVLDTGEALRDVVVKGTTPARPGVEREWREHFYPIHGHDGVVGIGIVCEEVTESAAAARALASSEMRYRSLVEQAVDGIFIAAADGRYVDVNSAGCRMLGYSRDELLARSIADVIAPEERSRLAPHVAELANEEISLSEWRFRRKDGSTFVGEVASRRLADGRLQAFLRDISERKRMEEQLRASQHSLQAALDVASMAAWGWDNVRGVKLWTAATKAIFGLPPETEMTRDLFVSLLHPDDVPRYQAAWAAAMDPAGNHVYQLEYRIRRASDGRERWISSKAAVDFVGDEPVRVMGALRDITDEKRAADALRDSEARLSAVVEGATDGIATIDGSGIVQSLNGAGLAMFGYAAEEVIGRNIAMLMPEPHRSRHDGYIRRYLETGEARIIGYGRELEGLRKDGSTFPLELSVSQVWAGANRLFVGLIRDITERKQAEAALRQSRDDLDRAQEVGRIGSWRLDVRENILTWSDENHRIFGVPKGTPLSYECFLSIVHPDDRNYVDAQWRAGLRGAPYDIEHRIVADGQVKWVREKAYLEFDAEGTLLGGFGITQDITDRKQRDEALRNSEGRLRAITDRAAEAIFVTDGQGRITFANPEAERTFGYTIDELKGEDLHELLHHHDAAGEILAAQDCPIWRIHRHGPTVRNHEDVFFRKDGSPVNVACSSAPLGLEQEPDGHACVFVVRDITQHKLAEERLRVSEERYKLVVGGARAAIWDWDVPNKTVFFSPRWKELRGLADDEVGNSETEWSKRIHPDDLDRVMAAVEAHFAGRSAAFDEDYRIRHKDGHWMWINDRGQALRDASGRVIRMAGSETDITERKRHEEQLQLLMREVNHRAKNMLGLIQAIAQQTASTGGSDFIERFTERVQALAASQDLLVRNDWHAVPLADLVRTQLSHFADLVGSRVTLAGPPLSLNPTATQSLGMALHELATNAAKYGALANDTGRIAIAWDLAAGDGSEPMLELSWVERGGPAVAPPRRRGFGSTVISEMVERGLGGEVAIDYAPAGLQWHFTGAAGSILNGRSQLASGDAPPAQPADGGNARTPNAGPPRRPGGRVLIVEDEPLIAAQIATVLTDAGYAVVGPAGNVRRALALIEQEGCDAVVLDVRLGNETSEPVARVLSARGTPFVVASGYSREQLPEPLRAATFVGKPLRAEILLAELASCLAGTDAIDRAADVKSGETTPTPDARPTVSVDLLREVSHRVKNNMSQLAAMIDLEQQGQTEPATKAALARMAGRVQALGIVYSLAHRSRNLNEIAADEYLDRLIRSLAEDHGAAGGTIDIHTEFDRDVLPIDAAIALGLIVNELTSNALQHCLHAERGGSIAVRYRKESDGRRLLTVEDDVTGAATDAQSAGERAGTPIVESLSKWLGAEVSTDRGSGSGAGTRVSLAIPADRPYRKER